MQQQPKTSCLDSFFSWFTSLFAGAKKGGCCQKAAPVQPCQSSAERPSSASSDMLPDQNNWYSDDPTEQTEDWKDVTWVNIAPILEDATMNNFARTELPKVESTKERDKPFAK